MPTYPVIYAGQKITAGLLTSMQPVQFWKTSNTDRTATTTLADDPDLTMTLAANAIYKVEFYLHYTANGGQFQTKWNAPAGAGGTRSCHGLASTVSDSSVTPGGGGAGSVRSGAHGYATAITYGDRANSSNQCFALEEAVLTTTSAGTLAIQWAQALSSANITRLASGSSLRVTRLA